MKKSYKALLGLAVLLSPVAAQAQSDSQGGKLFYPYNYVQVQGGGSMVFITGGGSDLISPAFGLSIGRQFSSVVGARLNFQGLDSKAKRGDTSETFKYLNTDLDLLLNLTNLFSKNNNHKMNVYVLGGLGLNYSWDKDWAPSTNNEILGHNFRVGAIAEYKIARPFSVSLEVAFDNMSDKFNPKINNSDDWMGTAKIGLAYNFGYSKKPDYVELEEPKPLSLYEQMQLGVRNRIDTWMKRLKGESKEDYLLRTGDDKIASLRLQYEKEISTDMAGDKIGSSEVSLGKYHSGKELLSVDFNTMPSITLSVPRDEVSAFRKADDMTFKNTVYGLNKDDHFEVLYTEVLNGNNSKTYVYNNLERKNAALLSSDGYLPLEVALQSIANEEKLQQITTNAVQEAKDQNILTDNTVISVSTAVVPDKDAAGKDILDYKVSYRYTVKDDFSVSDDFAPGKYDAENSKASVAMLNIIKKAFEADFAQYVKAGKACRISFTGTADAMPINGVIQYNGKYGDINNYTVNVNGTKKKISVTKKAGITNNEQLSLVRAKSVRDYIYKNVKNLDTMKTTDEYNIEVSSEVGSQHRRVMVDFLFYDAF
ncbi:MAG: porin family protein [Bacteroides sp.]|nr:porin family protein [Roseburia sp.]MCM1347111.1 porin family protein [Bacteroides sp.]MCM1421667.1 porin family protein [Bacteroides sp.]